MKRTLFLTIVLLGMLLTLTACNRGGEETPEPSPSPETATVPAYPEAESPTPFEEAAAPAEATLPPTSVPPTRTPTASPAPTATAIPPTPTATPVPYVYGVPREYPARTANFARPEQGCNWMGIAGQVFDEDGVPVNNLVVELGGSIAGNPVAGMTITADSDAYGAGSYEIQLGEQPRASVGTAWVRLYDLEGTPLSAPAYFSTSPSCNENLIILNFAPLSTLVQNPVYLPLINR
jgi:hypothetical protein